MLGPHIGEAYNVGTGESVTICELAEVIRDIVNADSEIIHTELRDGDIEHTEAALSKASEQLACDSGVSLREGLKQMIKYKDRTN